MQKDWPSELRIVAMFLLLDIVLVCTHLLSGSQLFDLDSEQNIPTFYQSFKLMLLAGLAALHLYRLIRDRNTGTLERTFWGMFAAGALFLGLDEALTIHENAGALLSGIIGSEGTQTYTEIFTAGGFTSSNWLLFYLPLLIAVLVSIVYFARKLYPSFGRKRVILLLAAAGLFGATFALEFIGTKTGIWMTSVYELIMITEETAEMMSVNLLLYFVISSGHEQHKTG
ncbi:MAG: hypothetical protein TR69_WS6001001334 [candidate division WS6 bacterium OLB20]|uniref:Uncharacterized protein n=1 Tax=candidate division WS6 bacterium OLB20 TaxID=1617426 RepID=A0A136LWK6_9BACT|nr:MAG: hypothetical protein TR69_WS6001001334 [candidate division WS6 bacterium OLB20]